MRDGGAVWRAARTSAKPVSDMTPYFAAWATPSSSAVPYERAEVEGLVGTPLTVHHTIVTLWVHSTPLGDIAHVGRGQSVNDG